MYVAREIGELERRPNEWKGLRIGVFRIENGKKFQIGEYERNYSIFYDTFFPFQQNGKDYALYSPDYTATRIMELPSCRDIGGEEPDSWGFCPVEYFVPTYIEQESISNITGLNGTFEEKTYRTIINNPQELVLSEFSNTHEFTNGITGEKCKSITKYRPVTALFYRQFGFVAGCIWGDDSSWKIQYLDLSEVEKGIIKRVERFGYIALPENQNLKSAIQMSGYKLDNEDYSDHIQINIVQTFNLETGKVVHPFD